MNARPIVAMPTTPLAAKPAAVAPSLHEAGRAPAARNGNRP
jgi:hypothetical protein